VVGIRVIFIELCIAENNIIIYKFRNI
jgi:hypothetical protein